MTAMAPPAAAVCSTDVPLTKERPAAPAQAPTHLSVTVWAAKSTVSIVKFEAVTESALSLSTALTPTLAASPS